MNTKHKEDAIVLNNGKMIEFTYDLTCNGAEFYIVDNLTKSQKKEFSTKLHAERDVVSIKFIN